MTATEFRNPPLPISDKVTGAHRVTNSDGIRFRDAEQPHILLVRLKPTAKSGHSQGHLAPQIRN